MKKLLFVLLLSGCCLAQTNTANRNDGNRLLQNCSSLIKHADADFTGPLSNEYDASWCLGYLRGFLAGFDAMALAASTTFAEYQTVNASYICFPDQSTIGQDARVLLKWLNDHPERLHEDGGWLTLAAFQDAYPCKAKHSDAKKAINNN